MAFDFYNPHTCRVICNIPPLGNVEVGPGEFVPTLKHEASGLTADNFRPFVGPSFLHPASALRRRKAMEKANITVPDDIIESTKHLDPVDVSAPVSVDEVRKMMGDLQKVSDVACSTGKGKVQT